MISNSKKLVVMIWLFLVAGVLGACQSQSTVTTPENPAGTSTPLPTSPSTTDGLILFSSYREGESELYTMDADGSNLTRLTDIEERANQPAWSPDGQWIAFVQRFDGYNLEIMVMPFDGLQAENSPPTLIRLTHSSELDAEPDWSPDGTKIAFTSNRSGDMHIWVMSTNGSGRAQLTQGHNNGAEVWNSSPKWSPDGSKILYRSDVGQNSEIFIMNPDGSGQRNLTQHPASDVDPAWSPDGSQIAFVSDRDGNEEIFVMEVDGSNPRRLTDHIEKDTYPVWSPDGERIAFYSMREGNYEIFTMRADGMEVTQLTDHYDFDGFPAWRPSQPNPTSVSISFEHDQGSYASAPDAEIISWVNENALPLDLSDSASNKTTLEQFGEQVGEKRAVDLGNPFLGIHETFLAQKDILEYLVTEKGFDTLIFEIDWLLGQRLDEYLRSGEGDPAQVLADFPDLRWHSQEALDLIEWVREHNQNQGEAPTIGVHGVIMPDPALAMDVVLDYVTRVDPDQKERIEKQFACFREFEGDWSQYSFAYFRSKGECRDHIQNVNNYIENRQEIYTAASSQQEFTNAFKAMRSIQQAEEAYRSFTNPLRFIEENLRWIVQQNGDGSKFVLLGGNWAGVYSDTKHRVYNYSFAMGGMLRPVLGEEPFTIGFSFGSGEIVAENICLEPTQLEAISISPVAIQSFEWVAHYGDSPASILLLDQLSHMEAGAEWLDQPVPLRLIGDQYAPILVEDYFTQVDLLNTFDALIYVDEVSPITLLP